ncbi:TatD family hydrolase [candidate division KSB1 bacterium]|nr:TatD family hydrolase [candidate division KSB1 bacterium]
MNPKLIDTHAHLQFHDFDTDRDVVLRRAHEAGVAAIICVSTDVRTSHAAIALAEQYPYVYAAVGIHPMSQSIDDTTSAEAIKQIAELAQHPKVVAIGEIGMDYYWMSHAMPEQPEVFVRQLELAERLHKPVIIRNRTGWSELISAMLAHGVANLLGVFQCFPEDLGFPGDGAFPGYLENIEPVLNFGLHLSFSGNLTFSGDRACKKSALQEVAKQIPLDRIILGTDSPYITPVPHRGIRNEPAYTVYIANKLAEIKGLSLAETCQRTTQNAAALFGLSQ